MTTPKHDNKDYTRQWTDRLSRLFVGVKVGNFA
jgi:hypothetical protein